MIKSKTMKNQIWKNGGYNYTPSEHDKIFIFGISNLNSLTRETI